MCGHTDDSEEQEELLATEVEEVLEICEPTAMIIQFYEGSVEYEAFDNDLNYA